jgi:hypothetical protein
MPATRPRPIYALRTDVFASTTRAHRLPLVGGPNDLADKSTFHYAHHVKMGERWADEAVRRESERWVHVPSDGVCLEDERRLLVHLPRRWGQSRVWRSAAPDEVRADDLIVETIGAVRTAGGGRLIWHTGEGKSPPFMDECLVRRGFETTEELAVLAFSLVEGEEPRLPQLGVPEGVSAGLVRDVAGLREALLVDSEVFSSPQPSGEEFTEYAGELEKLALRKRGASSEEGASLVLRFLAFADVGPGYGGGGTRRAMGAAGAQIVGETLRLWGAATREAFRGRGAYRALVLERCQVGRELGATLALAKANVATSGPTLERAGFRVVATERRHTLEIP